MNDTRAKLMEIICNQMANGCIAANVSSLSLYAGVCRSTIYKYYPDVVQAVKAFALGATPKHVETNIAKLELMRKKNRSQKSVIDYLTNICSNQLIEVVELRQELEQLQEVTSLRINYLESQLALARGPTLTRIK